MAQHKHADVIRAFADGKQIEVFLDGKWQPIANPAFYDGLQYRSFIRNREFIDALKAGKIVQYKSHATGKWVDICSYAEYKNSFGADVDEFLESFFKDDYEYRIVEEKFAAEREAYDAGKCVLVKLKPNDALVYPHDEPDWWLVQDAVIAGDDVQRVFLAWKQGEKIEYRSFDSCPWVGAFPEPSFSPGFKWRIAPSTQRVIVVHMQDKNTGTKWVSTRSYMEKGKHYSLSDFDIDDDVCIGILFDQVIND